MKIHLLFLSAALLSPLSVVAENPGSKTATPAQVEEIRAYIKGAWKTLTRSNASLAAAAFDPKFQKKGDRSTVYIPADEDSARVESELKKAMKPEDLASIELKTMPKDAGAGIAPGLLYLPKPYVVPGGRFNEMYGWDSYFILVGLLRDDELDLAKDMTDNFLYEVRHYGEVLNANRSYYLTRSQPPFLSEMVLGVYGKTKDKAWLEASVPALERYYRYWTEGPHQTESGLSRYFDAGEGPAPEVLADEKDAAGRTHYDRVKEFLKTHQIPDYPLSKEYDAKADELTPFFYKNDRSMRESGFDPSDRFGPFNSEVIDFNPVCLNSLLYRMESEMAEIEKELGHPDKAKAWSSRAAGRKERMNALLWSEEDGLYYDYNFTQKAVRRYPFVTTFYPLWAGIADDKRAARVRANLAKFERPGGLQTSVFQTGKQWDAPFAWAPMQIIAADGLRRYGFKEDADRVSTEFLSVVLKEFIAHHAIKEKYDAAHRSSDIGAGIKFGYSSNEIGFGWTNAAFEELYSKLSDKGKKLVLNIE